jgi:hypothetical protein
LKDKERRKNKSSDHLISVYLKLKKDEVEENESDRTDVWIRSFLRFCAIVYGFFVIDIILPSQQIHDKIIDVKFSRTISGQVKKSNDGYNYLSKAMSIITNSGYLTTLAVTGYEKKGEKVLVGRSLLFSRVKYMFIGKYPFPVTPAINFFGWAFFMPLLAFFAGIYGGFFTKKLGPVLFLGAINVLFFIQFIMILFLI